MFPRTVGKCFINRSGSLGFPDSLTAIAISSWKLLNSLLLDHDSQISGVKVLLRASGNTNPLFTGSGDIVKEIFL